MSLADHLLHRCTIERATVEPDDRGHDVTTWATYLTDVSCRLVQKAQRVQRTVISEGGVIAADKLLVPAGTDVRPGDQVVDVIFEDGTVEPGPYRIVQQLRRTARVLHHITLELERVQQPGAAS